LATTYWLLRHDNRAYGIAFYCALLTMQQSLTSFGGWLELYHPDFLLKHPLFFTLLLNTRFLLAPIVLSFVLTALGRPWSGRKMTLHYLPFGFYLGYYLIFSSQLGEEYYQILLDPSNKNARLPAFETFRIVLRMFLHVSYLLIALGLLVGYRNKPGEFINKDPDRFSWIFVTMLLSMFSFIALLIITVMFDWPTKAYQPFLQWLPMISFMYVSIKKPWLMVGPATPSKLLPENEEIAAIETLPALEVYGTLDQSKHEATPLKEKENHVPSEEDLEKISIPTPSAADSKEQQAEWELIFGLVEEAMLIQKIWSNQELDVRKVAEFVNHPAYLVSQAINRHTGDNFNTYVNKWRVNGVIEMLNSEEDKNLTMEGIAGMNGFKSKSTFYAAFKKEKGVTPQVFMAIKSEITPNGAN
jgi:AraC-like DNA-binding protein